MANFGEITVHVKVDPMFSFIPRYYYQALARRAAEKGYVMINDLGDAITLKEFERLVEEASQYEVIMPYEVGAMKYFPRTPVPDMENEWHMEYDPKQEEFDRATHSLMVRIAQAFNISAAEIGSVYDNWRQEYLSPRKSEYLGDRIDMPVQSIDSVTASTSHLGFPMYQPNLPAMPAMPTKAPEPEFGVVIIGGTEVPLSTVNALLSGKFIQEGENIDTSFRQYIVLFRNDDWHRNEAVNLRQQLRDLIRGVEVVLIPVNGG